MLLITASVAIGLDGRLWTFQKSVPGRLNVGWVAWEETPIDILLTRIIMRDRSLILKTRVRLFHSTLIVFAYTLLDTLP